MRGRRGFTLIEVMIVTAVIAIGAAVTVPAYYRALERADRRAVVRNVTHHLHFVRMAALAHGSNNSDGQFRGIPGLLLPVIVSPPGGGPAGLASLIANPWSVFRAPPSYTALRVMSPTSYMLVAKRNGTVQNLGVVVVNEDIPTMRIIYPSPLMEIRFSSAGHRDSRSAPAIVLRDATTGETARIDVSLTGVTEVR